MRFMILVKATEDTEAGIMPSEEVLKEMIDYHAELDKAGILREASGLQPSSKGWRMVWDGGRTTIVDGPFAETKELLAGYTIIEVKSREEAMEWIKRFPNPQMVNGSIEVRQLFELDDFGDNEPMDRFRELDVSKSW